MKKSLLLFSLFLLLSSSVTWALPTTKPFPKEKEAISVKAQKKAHKEQEKWQKKKGKLEKKFQKLEKKLAKKGIDTTNARNGLWDDDTFKLGALIALGGLLLTILGVLPILGGIFSLIGGLMMIVGVGLMIWVLIDSY
ncbi:MAG: hypothetical protein AB8G86_20250 [Saprospiraceae bacterium]